MPNSNPTKNNDPAKSNRVGRHQARCGALQSLYQWQVSGNSIEEIKNIFLEKHAKKSIDSEYYAELVCGVTQQHASLDALLMPYLKRNFQEIDPIELSVLRIATYELAHRLDIPYRVVINEALELVKKFGSIEGYKFINSILDLLAKQIRIHE